MRVLANEYREERMLRAEEKAARLPALLTVPMILFILPPLFVVLIGPAILRLMDAVRRPSIRVDADRSISHQEARRFRKEAAGSCFLASAAAHDGVASWLLQRSIAHCELLRLQHQSPLDAGRP